MATKTTATIILRNAPASSALDFVQTLALLSTDSRGEELGAKVNRDARTESASSKCCDFRAAHLESKDRRCINFTTSPLKNGGCLNDFEKFDKRIQLYLKFVKHQTILIKI